MRTSIQRDLILEIVNTNFSHLSANEIYLLAKNEIDNISLGTVYRNLNQLCENNLIKKIKCNDNVDRFDNTLTMHSHFICDKCGKIVDVFDNLIDKKDVLTDYKITDYDLVLRGICNNCQKED